MRGLLDSRPKRWVFYAAVATFGAFWLSELVVLVLKP
jgi:hypothetical protein